MYILVPQLEKITQLFPSTPLNIHILRGTLYDILLFCWWPYFGHKNIRTHALDLLLEIILSKLESLQIRLFNILIWVRGESFLPLYSCMQHQVIGNWLICICWSLQKWVNYLTYHKPASWYAMIPQISLNLLDSYVVLNLILNASFWR